MSSSWCAVSPVTRTTFLSILMFLRLFCRVMGVKLTTWRYNLDLWPLRSPRMYVMRAIVLRPSVPSLKFPFQRYGWFSVTALSDLVTLTFDLSISNCGRGSLVSRASFLSVFSFLRPSVPDLGSCTVQDRQTGTKLCRKPPQYAPPLASWPLTFWPWKWCLSHVWRGLPLCQF